MGTTEGQIDDLHIVEVVHVTEQEGVEERDAVAERVDFGEVDREGAEDEVILQSHSALNTTIREGAYNGFDVYVPITN